MFYPDTTSDKRAASNAFTRLGDDTRFVSVIGTSDPACDYDDDFFVRCHPSVFPMGTGKKPKKMGLDTYLKILVQRHPRQQHAQNVGFLFDAFDVLQRHNVNTQASVQLKLSPRMGSQLTKLTDGDLQLAISTLSKGMGSIAFYDGVKKLPHHLQVLLRGMRQAGARILGSPGSFLSFRSKVIASNAMWGSRNLMMNLCISEQDAQWTFELAGKAYTFNEKGKPEGRPAIGERLRIIAANPVACAEFFVAYVAAFCEVFLGWPMESPCQVNANCFFGRVDDADLKYEASGRGGFHAHGQAILAYFEAANVQRILEEGGAVRQRLHEVMEGIMTQFHVVVPHSLEEVPSACSVPAAQHAEQGALNACMQRVLPKLSVPTEDDPVCWSTAHNVPVDKAQQLEHDREVLAERLPLQEASDATFNAVMATWVASCVMASNLHAHRATCMKGRRAGDDSDCRMGYDRLLVQLTMLLSKDHGLFLVRRDDRMVVPYLIGLMMACPGNHTFSLTCEGSRWLREYQLWMEAKAEGTTSVRLAGGVGW